MANSACFSHSNNRTFCLYRLGLDNVGSSGRRDWSGGDTMGGCLGNKCRYNRGLADCGSNGGNMASSTILCKSDRTSLFLGDLCLDNTDSSRGSSSNLSSLGQSNDRAVLVRSNRLDGLISGRRRRNCNSAANSAGLRDSNNRALGVCRSLGLNNNRG